jgi:hypothetical protein
VDAKLEIIWDGEVPGLPEHRLSLDAFGPALNQLLAAFRRLASDIHLQARGPGQIAGRAGRLAKEAENLDIQVETITGNSPVRLAARVVELSPPPMPLIADLPERALDQLLIDIEREAAGYPTHHSVRSFLKTLPVGLVSQTYIHKASDGRILRQVQIGAMALPAPIRGPFLINLTGVVVGVGFEEGRQEVKVRADSREIVSFTATSEQADHAIDLRLQHVDVLAVAVEGGKPRLLGLTPGERLYPDEKQRADIVFNEWSGLLARLAQ